MDVLIKSNLVQQDQPLLSIITVVYNNVEGIKTAIESVISQDYAHIEYIVVDGGSTDGTIEIINEYPDKIPVFISESDKGIYDALNKGVLRASGDVVAILHSDDRFCNTHVCSNIMKHMDKTRWMWWHPANSKHPSFKIARHIITQYFPGKIIYNHHIRKTKLSSCFIHMFHYI